jgi:hypothetical protein
MPALLPAEVQGLVTDLIQSSRVGDEAPRITPETTVARIRLAMSLPVADRFQPLAGAVELLSEIG